MTYSLYKITWQGLYFTCNETDETILVDMKIVNSGKTIFADITDYELDELNDYILED